MAAVRTAPVGGARAAAAENREPAGVARGKVGVAMALAGGGEG